MPSIKISNDTFRKLSNYIVHTGAGDYNLPREDVDALYSPGWPIAPVTMPMDSDLPREFDYPVGINYTLQPRVGYETLMSVAALQAAYLNVPEVSAPVNMIIRLLCGFQPYFRNKSDKAKVKDGYELNHLLEYPEKDIPWSVWLTKYKKSSKIYSAPAYYKKRDKSGLITEMEYVDGSTLFLIINSRGKLPQPNEVDPELAKFIQSMKRGDRRYLPNPKNSSVSMFDPAALLNKSERFVPFSLETYLKKADEFTKQTGKRVPTTPAFTQIIKGVPFSFWDKDQVYFQPEPPYPAVNTPYGESYIERAWPWINYIALITAFELGHYRTGNMPEGVFTVPLSIAPNLPKLASIEKQWNARMAEGTQTQHARNRFMFDGTKWFPTKKADWQQNLYQQAVTEILYAIGVPPEAMGIRPGRNLSGSSSKSSGQENQQDMMQQLLESEKRGIEQAFNQAVRDSGDDQVECYLDYPTEQIDPSKQEEDLQNGFIHGENSMNDMLSAHGKEPHGDAKDKENPWNWHFMVVGNAFYVFEKLKVADGGLARPANPVQPGANPNQAGGEPFNPERALAQGQERPKQVQEQVAQKILKSIEAGDPLDGVTYSIPIVIHKEVGVGSGYGGYNLEGDKKPKQIHPTGSHVMVDTPIHKDDTEGRPADCDPDEYAAGMKEEQEHADTVNGDQGMIRSIVIDHLKEDPKYYSHMREAGMMSKRYKIVDGTRVINEDTGKTVPGGDHKTHDDAVAHLQALYANVPDANKMVKADITDHDGAMVAIFIPDKVAKQLRKIADGLGLPKDAKQELSENMHVTLAFLPDTKQATEESARVLGCVQSTALAYAPLNGNIQGYGIFNGKDGIHVLYATLDAPDLPFIRTAICEALDKAGIEYAKDHGFVPHITLAYFPDDWQLPKGFSVPDIDCKIDGITFALGDKLTTITLQEGDTRLGKRNIIKIDWAEYFKHCGVCPEDAEYWGAPIAKDDVEIPDKGHANKDMEFVMMKPEGLKPLPALWKPEGGEDEKLNERIDGHQCPREEVAWLLDQCLGFHLVPVAYVSELEGERGAVLWYVKSPPTTDPKPAADYAPEWIERMAVLDYILCNLDRPDKLKNYLSHPDDPRRVMAIDNSLSCSPNKDDQPKSVFVDLIKDKPLSAETLQAVKMCIGDRSMWRDMQDVLAEWDTPAKAKQAVANMQARAQTLLADKSITDITAQASGGGSTSSGDSSASKAMEGGSHTAQAGDPFEKYNENHDELGRFAEGSAHGTGELKNFKLSDINQARALAQTRRTKALGDKPALDKLVTNVAARNGAQLVVDEKSNTANSVKGEDSLTRKILTESEKNQTTLPMAESKITDVNRYLVTYPPDKLTEGAKAVSADLKSQGFQEYDQRMKNYFGRGMEYGYEGYNTVWTNPQTNQTFELQFHTPESFVSKEQAHPLYEQYRVSTDPAERKTLVGQMAPMWNITRPANHETLPSYLKMDISLFEKFNPNHDELGRFAEGSGAGNSPLDQHNALDRILAATGRNAENPGMSYNIKTGEEPTTGYALSIHEQNSQPVQGWWSKNDQEQKVLLKAYVDKNMTQLNVHGNNFGLWVENDTKSENYGTMYMDISTVVQDRQAAITMGVAHNQIAIWDIANKMPISTGGTGEGKLPPGE